MAAVMTFQSLPKNKLCAFIFSFLLLNLAGREKPQTIVKCRIIFLVPHTFLPTPEKKEEIFKQQLGGQPQTPTTSHKSSFVRNGKK